MIHLQATIPGWLTPLAHLPDDASLKAFSASHLREAKQHWAGLGRDPARLFTVFRKHGLATAPRSATWEQAKAHWRGQFNTFVDATYRADLAPYVDGVEEANEYWGKTTWDDPDAAGLVQSTQAAIAVWNDEYRGQGGIPAHCRLIVSNSPVGNRIPRIFYEMAVQYDCILGTHPYILTVNGQRAADDWENHSGLWNRDEQEHGLKPLYFFGETGPYNSVDNGWRHESVLNGSRPGLVSVTRSWVTDDVYRTPAYREGRIKGFSLFTTGLTRRPSGELEWPYYELGTDDLIAVADMLRDVWRPGQLALGDDAMGMDPVIKAMLRSKLDEARALVDAPDPIYRVRLPGDRALRDAAGNPAWHPILAPTGSPAGLVKAGTIVSVYADGLRAGAFSDRLAITPDGLNIWAYGAVRV